MVTGEACVIIRDWTPPYQRNRDKAAPSWDGRLTCSSHRRNEVTWLDPRIIRDLLILGALLLSGIVTTKVASRMGVPALVLFIAVGMILGSDVTGLIYFDDAWLAQFVGTIALVVILFEGGLQANWKQLRRVAVPALSLATVGVLITVILTGLVAWLALDLDLPMAMLVGSIVGSTDAAAVFAVISGQNIRKRLKATLEVESGANDPMAVFLTLLMLAWIQTGAPKFWAAIGFLVWQMGLGLVIGILLGMLTVRMMSLVRLEASGLYPILLFGMAIFTFAAASWLNGSGLIAVYILAIYLGNRELPYRQSIVRFFEGTASLAQMVMFILLGLLVFPGQLTSVIAPGLVIAGGLMLVARPAAVWLSTIGMGFTTSERTLLAWAGLRGAVPIVLATFPMLAGITHSNMIFNVVFFVVLTSALIQGATVSRLASFLGLTEGAAPVQPMTLELVAMEKVDVDLVEFTLPSGSPAEGRRLAELALPEHITVSALVRSGRVISPRGGTRLQAEDVLFLLMQKNKSHLVRPIFEGPDDAAP